MTVRSVRTIASFWSAERIVARLRPREAQWSRASFHDMGYVCSMWYVVHGGADGGGGDGGGIGQAGSSAHAAYAHAALAEKAAWMRMRWQSDSAVVSSNINRKLTARDTSHPETSLSKAAAAENIAKKLVALLVFQLLRSLSKRLARRNILAMLTTFATSQRLRSALKSPASSKRLDMLVTCDTSCGATTDECVGSAVSKSKSNLMSARGSLHQTQRPQQQHRGSSAGSDGGARQRRASGNDGQVAHPVRDVAPARLGHRRICQPLRHRLANCAVGERVETAHSARKQNHQRDHGSHGRRGKRLSWHI